MRRWRCSTSASRSRASATRRPRCRPIAGIVRDETRAEPGLGGRRRGRRRRHRTGRQSASRSRVPSTPSSAVGPVDEPAEWVRVHAPGRAQTAAQQRAESAYRVAITAGDVDPRVDLGGRGRGSWATPTRARRRVLAAAADQIGGSLERDRLQREATTAEISRRSDALKSALLDSVSHDLRTPLASIRAAAGTLMDPDIDWPPRAAPRDRRVDRSRGRLAEPARHEPARHEPGRGRRASPELVVLDRRRPRRRGDRVAPGGRWAIDPSRSSCPPDLPPVLGRRGPHRAGPGQHARQRRRSTRDRSRRSGSRRTMTGRSPRPDHHRGRRPRRARGGAAAPVREVLSGASQGRGFAARDGHRAGGRPRPGRGDGRPGRRRARASSAAWPSTSTCAIAAVDDAAASGIEPAGDLDHMSVPPQRRRSCSSRTTTPTRHAIATFLRGHGHDVVEAGDARRRRSPPGRRGRPDLIVLDLGLPDQDGLTRHPPRPARGDDADPRAVGPRPRGATRWRRSTSAPTTTSPSRSGWPSCARGSMPCSVAQPGPALTRHGVVRIGALTLDVGRRVVTVGDRPVHLTPREYEVLKVLVTHAGRLVTHGRLLRAVWGTAYSDEAHYVHVYVSQIRRKLEAADPRPDRWPA